MAIYSIKDLEQLSDIKAHTIRMWEHRYKILEPKRTQTNIRYYDEKDLRFLLNVSVLNKNGIKISKIAKMSDEEMAKKVADVSDVNFEHTTQLDTLTLSMLAMDERKFEHIISANIRQLGFEQTMIEIINPFLDKLGLLWLTGSINKAQEQFIAYLIRQKLITAIDGICLTSNASTIKFLVFLPECENQELSLLFLNYLLKVRGFRVIYLGNQVPFSDLEEVYKIHQPEYMYTFITESFCGCTKKYVDNLSTSCPNAQILLSGYQFQNGHDVLPNNVSILPSLQETLDFLLDLQNK